MAKAKRSGASGGPHKSHGPKRHQFAEYGKVLSMEFAKAGVLDKYNDKESWRMACIDRGRKSANDLDWADFCKLKTIAEKKAWFERISEHK